MRMKNKSLPELLISYAQAKCYFILKVKDKLFEKMGKEKLKNVKKLKRKQMKLFPLEDL
jgi:hypothetical protein